MADLLTDVLIERRERHAQRAYVRGESCSSNVTWFVVRERENRGIMAIVKAAVIQAIQKAKQYA